MISIYDRIKLSVSTSAFNALIQWLDLGIKVRFEKERHTDAIIGGTVDHTVICRFPFAICPSLDHISDIDDERAWDWVCINPGAIFELDLQSAFRGIRKEKSNATVVCKGHTLARYNSGIRYVKK